MSRRMGLVMASSPILKISVCWYHWTVWGWELVLYHADDGTARPRDLVVGDRIMVKNGTAGWGGRNYENVPFSVWEGYVWVLSGGPGGDWRAYPKVTPDLYGDEGIYNGGSVNSLQYINLN